MKMGLFKNIFGSLFTYKDSSRNSQNNKASIKTKENYGKIAGRDIVESSSKPGWIEQRKVVDDTIHHFRIFFSLASQIKDQKCSNKCSNSFSDCRNRMNREFNITRISVLEENHQKEIYNLHQAITSMKTINEYTHDAADDYLKKLQKISDYYAALYL